MLLIVAHHYVVNSTVLDEMIKSPFSPNSIFLYILGGWGKTGINCFVMITGYFMCKSNITIEKFIKLLAEIMFYNIVIYGIFLITGYESLFMESLIKAFIPVYRVGDSFTSCFLMFYLFIPFLNILTHNIDEKMHLRLLALLGFIYIFFGTIPKTGVTMNHVSWFVFLYFIASYIRLYPKEMYEKKVFWGIVSIGLIILSIFSIFICISFGQNTYGFVTDSNTFLAVALGISSFLFFKSLKIKNSKIINTIAASTFLSAIDTCQL